MKPLSKRARAEILRIARTDPQLDLLLRDSRASLVAEPNFTDRHAPEEDDEVLLALYDYARRRSVVAIIDRSRGRVASVETTPVHFQLSGAEQREAEQLAADDVRVRRFLRRRAPNPITRLYFPPAGTGADAAHRHAIVFIRPSSTERRYAVVDLTAERVLDVLHPSALTER